MGYDHDHMSDYGLFIICTPWQFWLKIFGSDAERLFRILNTLALGAKVLSLEES